VFLPAAATVAPTLIGVSISKGAVQLFGLVAIIGPAGSGRLPKACQFVQAKRDEYDPLIFHAYNNDTFTAT